jgi:hypothetical protein
MTESLIPGLRSLSVVQHHFETGGEEAAITVAELAAGAGVPSGTARRILVRLVEMKVLVVIPGHGREPDVYRLPSGRSRPHGSTPSGGRGSGRNPSQAPHIPRRGRPRADLTRSNRGTDRP